MTLNISHQPKGAAKVCPRPLHRTAAWLLVLGLFCVQFAAASGPLHKFFHKDAGQADHHCAITLFSAGQVDATPVEIKVNPPAPKLALAAFTLSVPLLEAAAHLLPPGRGPPSIPGL